MQIKNPLLWECEVGGAMLNDNGMKGGSKKCRVLRVVDAPVFTPVQRAAFAILVAYEFGSLRWRAWADRWLTGDRSYSAADADAAAANPNWFFKGDKSEACTYAYSAALSAGSPSQPDAAAYYAAAAAYTVYDSGWLQLCAEAAKDF